MPADRRFCPYERRYVDNAEFLMIGKTLVHVVDPLHRGTDGIPVDVVDAHDDLVPIEAITRERAVNLRVRDIDPIVAGIESLDEDVLEDGAE